MTTDFRAELQQLVKAIKDWDFDTGSLEQDWSALDRAEAALAQPEQVAPTNKDLDALERKHWKLSSVVEYDSSEGFSEAFPKEETFDHRAYARAVLALWGAPDIHAIAAELNGTTTN